MLAGVDVVSPGYRTDLMLRALEGSHISDGGDHLVIRSPAHPAFWRGNFLLLDAPPRRGETGRWLSLFAAEFPAAGHVTLGTDVSDAAAVQAGELLEAGFRLDRMTVMTASAVQDPPHPCRTASYRQLAGDDDWRRAAGLRAACSDGEPGSDRTFVTQRIEAERQGLAGTLVSQAGRPGLRVLGASTLVLAADPEEAAIRIYRSVGFAELETQVAFERPPPASADS
jgi:hypothetical protein